MALDDLGIIALVTLIVGVPPAIWVIYKVYTIFRPGKDKVSNPLLPTHSQTPNLPSPKPPILPYPERAHTWSPHTAMMLEDMPSASHHDARAART